MRFGYWHFAFLAPESNIAAEASECAGDQDAFWEYHDLLFEVLNSQGRGLFNTEGFKAFAAQLKLDTKAFNECLDSGKHSEWVQKQTEIARQIGVRSTPSFVINGQPLIGAQPFDAFKQTIEQMLNTAQ